MKQKTIYLDNAATTFPKPLSVCRAAYECMKDYCGNPGRASHPIALKAAEKIYECREKLADMFGAEYENVCFTFNTTYALNTAIKGVVSEGDHILLSNMEHNSVLRPVHELKQQKKCTYDIFDVYGECGLTVEEIIKNIDSKAQDKTKVLICTHMSNICSYTLPIEQIGKYCKEHGIIFIVDAAQSAGHIPIDIKDMNIDILCMPSHKGLYGPQGCGIMILGEDMNLPRTLVEGGNGIASLDLSMGNQAPERFEAGTLCTPAIAGLCEGVDFIEKNTVEYIDGYEKKLWERAYSDLCDIPEIKIYAPEYAGPIFSFNIEGYNSDEVGNILSGYGICVRTGFHCSMLGHSTLKTDNGIYGGCIRASFGMANTLRDVDLLCRRVKEIIP